MNHINRAAVKVVQCEVYSRVSGYFRPVNQWNKAKQAEFKERQFAYITEAGQWEKAKKI